MKRTSWALAGLAALAAGVLATAPAAATVSACGPVAPFTIGYTVTSLNFAVNDIVMFQGQPGCYSGTTNSFSVSAGGGLLADPFTKTNPIDVTFLLGVATDIVLDEFGEPTASGNHLVIFGNDTWASGATSIAFGTLFPQVLETDLINALGLLSLGLPVENPLVQGAFNTLVNFYDYQFTAPGGGIGFAAGDSFSILGFTDGKFIGRGQSFVTPITAAIPEPASWAMLIAGFGLVGAVARRRAGAAAQVAA
jgi:hypothetical protein